MVTRGVTRADSCNSARRGLDFYVSRTNEWRHKREAAGRPQTKLLRSCKQIRSGAEIWRSRAHRARVAYAKWEAARRVRFHTLYAKWRCIHEHEGAWNASNSPYHGGLQFDSTFQDEYGPEFVRRWGGAEHWPVWAQLIAAERAYHGFHGWAARGFGPWPNTRRICGV